MLNTDLLKRVGISVALILLGMLVALALSTGHASQLLKLSGPSSAQEPETSSPVEQRVPTSPEAPQAWHTCTSVGVAAYANRIHVQCSSPAPGGIYFFALGTNNSAHAARVLSILSMAHVTGKQLDIEYNPSDTSGTAIGCQANDCRLILTASIRP